MLARIHRRIVTVSGMLMMITVSAGTLPGCRDLWVPDCAFEDPMEELSFLSEIRDSLTNCQCEISIIQGSYRNNDVFFTKITDPQCLTIFGVDLLDCRGNLVRSYGEDDYDRYAKEVKIVEILYRCND